MLDLTFVYFVSGEGFSQFVHACYIFPPLPVFTAKYFKGIGDFGLLLMQCGLTEIKII